MVKRLEVEFGDGRRPAAISFEEMFGDRVKHLQHPSLDLRPHARGRAAEAGAEYRFGETVTDFDGLDHGDVRVRLGDRAIHADWLVDASGQACVLGRTSAPDGSCRASGTSRTSSTSRSVATPAIATTTPPSPCTARAGSG